MEHPNGILALVPRPALPGTGLPFALRAWVRRNGMTVTEADSPEEISETVSRSAQWAAVLVYDTDSHGFDRLLAARSAGVSAYAVLGRHGNAPGMPDEQLKYDLLRVFNVIDIDGDRGNVMRRFKTSIGDAITVTRDEASLCRRLDDTMGAIEVAISAFGRAHNGSEHKQEPVHA